MTHLTDITGKETAHFPVNITILGATGSIGKSTVDVIERHPESFRAYALTANTNDRVMYDLCRRLLPHVAVMKSEQAAERLRALLRASAIPTEVLSGDENIQKVASDAKVDAVMAAVVGAAGLKPTLAAVKAGKRILLANKEALVMSGALFMQAVSESGSLLLPIDSEHNAIFQCLPDHYYSGQRLENIRRILLTASGGPFRLTPLNQLQVVTPEQACAHPNWEMGKKISVDSATLMNKGLELIEACWLFHCTPDDIEVHIHPESIIHSMVEYVDGSVLAQMGSPDMRTPISYGLAWPQRIESGVASVDLFKLASLHFEKPDNLRFPALSLASDAFCQGGTAPAALNAANEVAVTAFLNNKLSFLDITKVIDRVLNKMIFHPAQNLDIVFDADFSARRIASELIEHRNF